MTETSTQNIIVTLERLAREVGLKPMPLHRELDLSRDLDADSLAITEMIFLCEDEFGVRFTGAAALEIKTIGDLVDYIAINMTARKLKPDRSA